MYTIESTNLENLRVPNGTPKDMKDHIIDRFKKYNKPFRIIKYDIDNLFIVLKHSEDQIKTYYWTFKLKS